MIGTSPANRTLLAISPSPQVSPPLRPNLHPQIRSDTCLLKLSYSTKLLMQSDLDKLAAKLYFHAGSFSEIYKSSFLSVSLKFSGYKNQSF
ncbi:hypothetical protein RchiOBHm_Chr5g0034131 [Rosa chinensis]|uniref:DUF7032 domain-containing protein n=1 Tax=Rosa chinensis TaxID=74649 RepID=A0A2P6QAW2_ROSCH|nr:hypothetical protein RchiOBHm_Chr5g0034131 [Rosa chinensis]